VLLHEQVFIIHRQSVKELLARFLNGSSSPIIIDFPSFKKSNLDAVTALKNFCADLLPILDQAGQPLTISSKTLQSPPSLAGLLLSYPSIYYTEDPASKVLDVEVAVFSVYTDSKVPRTLMQFSSPPGYVETIQTQLKETVKEWERRSSQLSPALSKLWCSYTGVESCTLKIQMETRRALILSL
jgi:hypothetical protein